MILLSSPSAKQVRTFRAKVWRYYHASRRAFPWRETRDPYHILVSEIMLQQTQTVRVAHFYPLFVRRFPGVKVLAAARPRSVLRAWQGLGYNRRALALWRAARTIVSQHGGRVPDSMDALCALPGVGRYTAAAIRTFAWDEPEPFVETNVRAAIIEHFFLGEQRVPEASIFAVASRVLDRRSPREWGYALMDFGVMVKSRRPGITRCAAVYRSQSPFEGSRRQLRGAVIRTLTNEGGRSVRALREGLKADHARLDEVLKELVREGFVTRRGARVVIGGHRVKT